MRPSSLKKIRSAGGIAYRIHDGRAQVVMIVQRGTDVLSLPKGIIENKESERRTAVRDVLEETGIKAEIVGIVGSIGYWYMIKSDNVRCHKTVKYFLMRHIKGEPAATSPEVSEARWVDMADAIGAASYKRDRDMLVKASGMINEILAKEASASEAAV